MGINLVSLLWGLAEATLFFIVPDVWLSGVSLISLKKALTAGLFSLAGALLGGTLIYFWSLHSPAAAVETIAGIPAIHMDMLVEVRKNLVMDGLWAVLFGPLSGIPYKTYAVQAANAGINLLPFLLISIPARLLRFQAVTLLCWSLSASLFQNYSQRTKYGILTSSWLLFYGFYFSKMHI
jgi:membrane protein YqaA with SNARE-associated domain